MTTAITYSRANLMLDAPLVTIETHISNGLPAFHIVGLANTAVKESKDRVRSAIINSNFEFPSRRITVNLAPADLPKNGGRFDLAIALGILAASKQINIKILRECEFAGELALTGELRPIKNTLPFVLATKKSNNTLILPTQNVGEAALCEDVKIIAANHLLKVIAHLKNEIVIEPLKTRFVASSQNYKNDLAEVKGQQSAKRVLEIAAAGGHNLLMQGPPGTGKTMLAQRLPSILPDMTKNEALELCAIKSIYKKELNVNEFFKRPFRSPHHSASSAALVGGGNPPRPGEISLAHHGILFLDELPEFNRKTIEALREPMTTKSICISRAGYHVNFPANFQFIAAMNPCPCGFLGDEEKTCYCSQPQIQRYRHKLSGPLLDRIDLHIDVGRIKKTLLKEESLEEESSYDIRKRVLAAVNRQIERGKRNAQLTSTEIKQYCILNHASEKFIAHTIEELDLSPRGYTRMIRTAKTIADLENKDIIEVAHLAEAVMYQPQLGV